MLIHKFLITKILSALLTSFVMMFSVFFIFSVIELLSSSHTFFETILLGCINASELLFSIPSVIFLLTVIIFWVYLHKTNELLIIRHYFSVNKIIFIFLTFILIIFFLEAFKKNVQNFHENIKESIFKEIILDELINKTLYVNDKDDLLIIRMKNIDLNKNSIGDLSIFKFTNKDFQKAHYSEDAILNNNTLSFSNSEYIDKTQIKKIPHKIIYNINQLSNNFFNHDNEVFINKSNILNKSEFNIINLVNIFISLVVYVLVFLRKDMLRNNANSYYAISFSFGVFIYIFFTSQISLDRHDAFFHLIALLTLITYILKIKSND